jgi:hypothetical protein
MSSTWTISANGRSFGPYTLEQMRSFAAEGRLAPHSLVARGAGGEFRMAGEDGELALLFRPAQPAPQPVQQRPVFFTAEGDIGGLGRRDADTAQMSRFLIAADMKSRSVSGLEEEIFRHGPAITLMPQVWLLTTETTLNALRNTLIQRLGRIDTLFVVDVGRNKAAWFNFGPEADSRIRRVWQEAQKAQAAE